MSDIPLDLTNLSTDLTCNQEEFDRWLDETSVPLSDDDIRAMASYFQSESMQYEESNLFDTI